MAQLGGAAGYTPACPSCNTSAVYYQDLRYGTYWYRCPNCVWSGSGLSILASLWGLKIEELEPRFKEKKILVAGLSDEVRRIGMWEELNNWLGKMIRAGEPNEEDRANILKAYLPDMRRSDWDSWKAGAGKYVFVTKLDEMPKMNWIGTDYIGKGELLLAAPIVDHMERPIGLWVKGMHESLLFPRMLGDEHQTGYVLLQNAPRAPVYVAGSAMSVLSYNLATSRITRRLPPLVPCVWSPRALPDPHQPVDHAEPVVLGRTYDVDSMALVLAKKLTTFAEVDRNRTLINSYERKTYHVIGWEETIVSAARRQGSFLRAWAVQIGLAGNEKESPYAFLQKHDESLFNELSGGNLFVASYGDRPVWVRETGVYSKNVDNTTILITNCIAKITTIYSNDNRGKRAECSGSIKGREFKFTCPLEFLADRRFTKTLAAECLNQTRQSLYCLDGPWPDRLGRLILALHEPIECEGHRPVWGWHEKTMSYRIGKVTIGAKGKIVAYHPNTKHIPNLESFKSDKTWLERCSFRTPQNEMMWASAALICSVIISKKRRLRDADLVGFVSNSRTIARKLPLAILGLEKESDNCNMHGWPGFAEPVEKNRGNSQKNCRLRIIAPETILRSRIMGRKWWSVTAVDTMLPTRKLERAARRLVPGWIAYYVREEGRLVKPQNLPLAVLHSMAKWFESLGGDPTVINNSARLIKCYLGDPAEIARTAVVELMAKMIDDKVIEVRDNYPAKKERDGEKGIVIWNNDGKRIIGRQNFIDLFGHRSSSTGSRFISRMSRCRVLMPAKSKMYELELHSDLFKDVIDQSFLSSLNQSGSSGSTSSTSLCEGSLGVISGTPSLIGQEPVACQSAQQAYTTACTKSSENDA